MLGLGPTEGESWPSDALPWGAPNPVPNEQIRENVRVNVARDVPRVRPVEGHGDGTFIFVGGGPSLKGCLDDLRARQNEFGATIFTSGKTLAYLVENGVTPWGWVNVDSKPHIVDYLDPMPVETRYFIASLSDPAMFDRLKDRAVWMFHAPVNADEMDLFDNSVLINGGPTTPLRALTLAYVLGYRRIEFYGVDSSFEEKNALYAYDKHIPQDIRRAECNGRTFLTTEVWARQAEYFDVEVAEWLRHDPSLRFVFHGDGLVQEIMRLYQPKE